ncbi:MAG TPA: hypothetical protein VGO93_13395 [Candidatus Xenobia bacterium]|jgi:hypothetical protein
MKMCRKGHPFDPGKVVEEIQFEIPCPFCVALHRSRVAKGALLTIGTITVLGVAVARLGPLAALGALGRVLWWVPAWLGVAVACLGSVDLMPWAYWFYGIGGVFLQTPPGQPIWRHVLEVLNFFNVPALHPETPLGWCLMGLLQGVLLGLVGISLDVFMRRIMNEPDPAEKQWVLKAFGR